MKTPFVALCLLLLASPSAAAPQLDPARPLQFELDAQHHLSIDELAYFKTAVEEALPALGYDGAATVERWGGGSRRPGGQFIDASFIRWGSWIPNEIECRFYATVEIDGETFDLGVVVGRSYGAAIALNHRERERLIINSAKDALTKLFAKLARHDLLAPAATPTE